MEKQYVVRDTHTRSITAIGYNPIRREINLGCEGKDQITNQSNRSDIEY